MGGHNRGDAMHASVDFWTNLGVAVAYASLLTRVLFMLLGNWKASWGVKLAAIHGFTLVTGWLLFVLWCSTPDHIYWWAGHKIFPPLTGWILYDILNSTGLRDPLDEQGAPALSGKKRDRDA